MKENLDTILTGVLVISSVVLSYYTYLLVNEARKARKAQVQPYISIHLEQSETDVTLMFIVIRNIGNGPAYNLKIDIIQDIANYDRAFGIAQVGLFKLGMQYCPPAYYKKYFLIETRENHDKKMKEELKLSVSYSNIYKVSFQEAFNLKLIELSGSSRITPPDTYMGRIAESLEEINKSLKK